MTVRSMLNTTVEVYRPTYTRDSAGGRTRVWSYVAELPAKVSQPSAEERRVAAQLETTLSNVVHLLPGANIQRDDELDTGGPVRLRVISVTTDSHSTYTRAECEVAQR